MTGGLIATVVNTHSPRMGVPDEAPDFLAGLMAGARELGADLRAMKPDLLVLASAHWISTFNWYLTAHETHEGVCVADEAPDLIPGIPYRRRGDPEFARALAGAMNEAAIPCGLNEAPDYDWDYGSLVPLLYLDPEAALPVVTMTTVICADLDECMKAGRLVDAAARATGRRVALVASTALSHLVRRGPDLWPTEQHQEMDRRLIALMCAGDAKGLAAWLPDYAKGAVAEMGGRTLATMVGATAALDAAAGPLAGRQYGPYGQSSASGNANICIAPKAA